MKHILLLSLLLLASCTAQRTGVERREDRRCARAERHTARAAMLCPKMLHRDSLTRVVDIALDGDTASGHALFTDTLGDLCDSIVVANNRLRAMNRALDSARMADNEALEREAEQRVASAEQALRNAQRIVRDRACYFETIEVDDPRYRFRIWSTPDGPLWMHELKPVTVRDTVTIAGDPSLSIDRGIKPQVIVQGVDEWWRYAAIILFLLTIAFFMLWRNAHMKR